MGGGWLLSHEVNDAFVAVNRLLAAGEEVGFLKGPVAGDGQVGEHGTIFISARMSTLPHLERLAEETGLRFQAVAQRPAGETIRLRPMRVGLWDRYGGSMPSGWTRWLLEQFEFPFEVVFPQELDAGNLADRFDVLVFVDGGIPARDHSRRMYGSRAAEVYRCPEADQESRERRRGDRADREAL